MVVWCCVVVQVWRCSLTSHTRVATFVWCSAREVEFADMIALMTGGSRDDGLREVEVSVLRVCCVV